MNSELLYIDKLISISNDEIVLFNYYFPSAASKKIRFSEILKIETRELTIATGKWRIWGTGDFRTWFPRDYKRSKRDKVFFIFLKTKWIRIGFTVENSAEVIRIFKEKKLLIL
ncbi:MAG: hypothetical protein NTX22_14610 [Ignavibacteriales bacterium]|nr:hypothetical protein [Ignavibacteriales bacterium]